MNALSVYARNHAGQNAINQPHVRNLLLVAHTACHKEKFKPLTLYAVPTMKQATDKYFKSTSEIDWIKVADDPATDWQILDLLANHSSSRVRAAVADNANTNQSTLLKLAYDRDADLRYQLAENHNINRAVLEVLLQDENPWVRVRAEMTHRRTTH